MYSYVTGEQQSASARDAQHKFGLFRCRGNHNAVTNHPSFAMAVALSWPSGDPAMRLSTQLKYALRFFNTARHRIALKTDSVLRTLLSFATLYTVASGQLQAFPCSKRQKDTS